MIGEPDHWLKMTNVIFIHIPRTGGTVLKWSLNRRLKNLNYINQQDHRPATERRNEIGTSCWNKFYKFTIIRNPWDRALSMYLHERSQSSFKDWLLNTDLDQERYYCDNNHVIVDDIYRYENLEQSLNLICEKSGWPKFSLMGRVNNTNKNLVFDQESVDIVYNKCKKFIERFNYDYQYNS
jgi:hypothetical protein